MWEAVKKQGHLGSILPRARLLVVEKEKLVDKNGKSLLF